MSETPKKSLFDEIVGVKQTVSPISGTATPTKNWATEPQPDIWNLLYSEAAVEAAEFKPEPNFYNFANGMNTSNTSFKEALYTEANRSYPKWRNDIPQTDTPEIKYLFNEGKYLEDAKVHIDSTYNSHYSGQYQATSIIIDAGHGTGFNIGNIIKYAKRYGKKNGYNKEDLLKIIHYATMQMYVHDTEKLS